MKRLAAAVVGVAAALALLTLVPPAAGRPAPGSPTTQEGAAGIAWSPCPGSDTVQCGQVTVPVDWARPHGATTSVGVALRPADDPAQRIGTLFFNPGGPGYSGLEYLTDAADLAFSPTLRSRFDIVVVDPRGVGMSSPVRCRVPVLARGVTLFPRSAAEFRALVAHNREVGRSCLAHTGALLAHVDTASVARDHEAVRRALGESQVSWFMVSYGAQVGGSYAQMFPEHVRALVIDGALDHAFPTGHSVLDEARAVEDSFHRFSAWCRTSSDCALQGRDVGALYDRLVTQADRHPIRVRGAVRPVTGEDIRMNTEAGLLFKQPFFGPDKSWAGLSRAILAALGGDATAFASAPPSPTDGSYAAQAVSCLDYPAGLTGYRELRARMRAARLVAPHLQGASQFWTVHSCLGWPEPVVNPPAPLDVRGVRTLIVNSTHDPSTPYAWALSLAGQIHGSTVLTRFGDGHTSYSVSPCAQTAIDDFLVTTTSPAHPVCTG